LALKVVEARGDKPSDEKLWRQLITFAPRWVVRSASFRLREERRIERRQCAASSAPNSERR
jgi:hypothetical protein